LITAILAVISYHKYRLSHERYFLFFLWYVFLLECVGAVMGDILKIDNTALYNVYTITSMLFYFFWYHSILKKKSYKKIVLFFGVLLIIVAFFNMWIEPWDVYHSYTFLTGALCLLVLTLFHFNQLLNSNEVLKIKYKLSFWISTALILFHVGMIPLFFLAKYTGIDGLKYLIILLSLNFVLYGCYIVGFLWTKKEYNRF